ncbi:hypothetical protein [Novosphingobium huizhouense]|uniref:hypothetical protein n=1 Tax=Novosphingobium huizhouense TaxID=2866625 RepID=UPI001CD8496B|nr:hypothetical protein [Novosphingobium huizhouense]
MRIERTFPRAAVLAGLAASLVLAPASAGARKAAETPVVVAEELPVELTGSYKLDAGPDVSGSLSITRDHRFAYRMVAGALSEEAAGTWEFIGARTCLTTVPAPQPPAWRAMPVASGPTVRVVLPDGTGLAGIGVRVGLGIPVGESAGAGVLAGGYTLDDGWVLPAEEKRAPRWVELFDPVHDLASPRFPFDGSRRLLITLVPNDMGKAKFDKTCLDLDGGALVLRRPEGEMKFYRFDR